MHPPDPPVSTHRIRVTWNADIGGTQELPFVIGVLADLSGMPEKPLPRLRYRRFVPVEVRSLDDLVAQCAPRLVFKVVNKLSEDDSKLGVELRFRRMEDFNPEKVAEQVGPLRALLDLRTSLASLRTSLSGNDKLEELLLDAVSDRGKLERIREEVAPQSTAPEPAAPALGPAVRPVHPTPPPVSARRPVPAAEDSGVWSRRIPQPTPHPEGGSILDQVVDQFRTGSDPDARWRSKNLVREFMMQVLEGSMTIGRDAEYMILGRIAEIDELLSRQLNEIMHSPEFMRLEATWKGLHYLVRHTRKLAQVKVKVLNTSKKELWRQFQCARERTDAQLNRKVLDQAAGTPGAEPFGLLIGDYQITRHPEDAELMEAMAWLGAAAHVPFMAAASAELLGLTSFTELTETYRLNRLFESDEYGKWSGLRSRVQSRYIGLVLPGMLLRRPYGKDSNPVERFNFEERAADRGDRAFLWGNAVWAFAVRTASDFARYGWFGAIRDADDYHVLPELPAVAYEPDYDIVTAGPTEVAIDDIRYQHLRSLGLIPLCRVEGAGVAQFFETWSCHKPRVEPDEDAPTTYESAEIDCILGVSRIAHYVMQIVRQDRQRFRSVQACEEHLRKWVAPYILPDYAKGTDYAAGFPLLEAQFRLVPPDDPHRDWKLELALRPQRSTGVLEYPVQIAIALPLPWSLKVAQEPPETAATAEVMRTEPIMMPNGDPSGRDHFLRKVFLAESCIVNRKIEVAVVILEDLSQQIERHRLDEWESPKLVSHVWDMLRRCYLLMEPAASREERSVALLRKICRLDPAKAVE